MKRVYVNEKWCLGCRLCEYHCAFAESGGTDIARALKGATIHPRVRVETKGSVSFAVSCRHCDEPLCVKSCITGALQIKNGIVTVDKNKCIGCYTCVLCCPFGAVFPSGEGAVQKCELCAEASQDNPACVKACPNRAIVYEERG